MDVICNSITELENKDIFKYYEDKYSIKIEQVIKDFFKKNNGGIPEKRMCKINDLEYEIRCFLSFNSNEYNSIDKSFEYFQADSNGKIFPIAKDSGDNYFCVNLENKKIYYWSSDDSLYYCIAETFDDFINDLT